MEIHHLPLRTFYAFLLIKLAVSESIHLGVLLPISMDRYPKLGRALALVIAPAIQHVYNHSRLSREWNITYTVRDSACHKTTAVGKTYELHTADAFIGPACSDSCFTAALLASYWNKPMISYSCSSVELSNRFFYPTFARTQPFSRTYLHETPDILLESMRVYNWTRAAIISTEDLVWTPIARSMTEIFQNSNISVPFTGFYVPSSSFSYKTFLQQVKDKARSKELFLLFLVLIVDGNTFVNTYTMHFIAHSVKEPLQTTSYSFLRSHYQGSSRNAFPRHWEEVLRDDPNNGC